MVYPYSSLFNGIIGLIILTCSIWNTRTCSIVLLSDTFETCGIFLVDSLTNSNKRGDLTEEIIETLQQKQKKPLSLIIKNELSQRDVHPDIFRSMKYDCYLHVHINFGNDLFSTIPLFKNMLQVSLYKKATFLIFVKSDPHKMFTIKSWSMQLDRQYRIFVVKIKVISLYKQYNPKPFVLYETFYFFCPFCYPCLVQLNSTGTKTFLSLNLSSFEKSWAPYIANHYTGVYDEADYMNNEGFCRQQNIMYLYKKDQKCIYNYILTQLIVFASGRNFTLNLYLLKKNLQNAPNF